eukprot:TRINITY_DN44978_c0_g1_i1.p1 TRINITY_DN44978_c0_g1~~TRINITY_DN44978_c0_g1_i1.p1  ORF type:complete len:115 (+),score=24.20 TRINITY_DN44978_c0_g1_i1:38-346(+)
MATVSHIRGVGRDGNQLCIQLNATPKVVRKIPASLGLFSKKPLRPGNSKAWVFDVGPVRAGGCNPSVFGTRLPVSALGEGKLGTGGGLGKRLLGSGLQVFKS